MTHQALVLLICPQTHQPLHRAAFVVDGDDVREGVLWTATTWYAIHEGAPRMVDDVWFPKADFAQHYWAQLPPAIRQQEAAHSAAPRVEVRETIAMFTNEWSRYQQQGWDTAQEEFTRKTSFTSTDLQGKLVLDVGIGNGRYAVAASRLGARVIGVDLIGSIGQTTRVVQPYGVQCVQADILRLPFRPGTFDVLFSIGVLHHIPDTERAFRGLVSLLRENGTIATTYYRRGFFLREVTDTIIRSVSTRLPDRWVWALAYVPASIAKLLRHVPIARIHGKRFALDQLIHTYVLHLRPSHDICYDWWAPKVANRFTRRRVLGWHQTEPLRHLREVRYGPGAVAFRAEKGTP